jgi:hypothetical protein
MKCTRCGKYSLRHVCRACSKGEIVYNQENNAVGLLQGGELRIKDYEKYRHEPLYIKRLDKKVFI